MSHALPASEDALLWNQCNETFNNVIEPLLAQLSCCHNSCIKTIHVLRQKIPSLLYFNASQVKPCGNAFKLLCLLPKEHA